MTDEKKPQGPGIAKAAPPRPSEKREHTMLFTPVDPNEMPTRPEPILPTRRLTPIGMAAVTGDEHEPDMRPVSKDVAAIDTPYPQNESKNESQNALNSPPPLYGLSEKQIQAIADQLKAIAVTELRKSSIPPDHRRSLPVRAAKYAWTKSPFVGMAVTLLGILVEIGARAYLNKAGPGTALVNLLGQILERMSDGG